MEEKDLKTALKECGLSMWRAIVFHTKFTLMAFALLGCVIVAQHLYKNLP